MKLEPAAPMEPLRLGLADLGGTAASLHRAASSAGFDVEVRAGFGVRLPKVSNQPYRWQAWTTLYGFDGASGFQARQDDDGWQVTIARAGWPLDTGGSVVALRRWFASRTATVMR